MSLRFNMLLEEAGVRPTSVRLLRHQPTVAGRSLVDIWRTDRADFEAYQAYQMTAKRAHFTRSHWASFIGTWDGRTMFAGLYAIGTPTPLTEARASAITGTTDMPGEVDAYSTTYLDLLAAYEASSTSTGAAAAPASAPGRSVPKRRTSTSTSCVSTRSSSRFPA